MLPHTRDGDFSHTQLEKIKAFRMDLVCTKLSTPGLRHESSVLIFVMETEGNVVGYVSYRLQLPHIFNQPATVVDYRHLMAHNILSMLSVAS